MAFNELTDAEAERLAILAEECAEVIYVVGKILRHGYESYNPTDDRMNLNRFLLENELSHVANIVDMMIKAGDINELQMSYCQEAKAETIGLYLHHN